MDEQTDGRGATLYVTLGKGRATEQWKVNTKHSTAGTERQQAAVTFVTHDMQTQISCEVDSRQR